MKRSKHSLSHYKLATFDMGQLVPVGMYEVLPGDSIRHHTAALLRVSPLQSPVMHPVSVRLHHWFVPYRLLWDGWEDFITGGADGNGGSSGDFPYIASGGSGFSAGTLADYLGVPPGVNALEVSALPFRAYQMIWKEFYRDQDLQTAPTISTGSGADSTTTQTLQSICWEKDYFTTARPWTQKGDDVTVPLGTTADLVFPTSPTAAMDEVYRAGEGTLGSPQAATGSGVLNSTNPPSVAGNVEFRGDVTMPGDAYADLATAVGASINDIRRAFAIQRYQEARAMYGSRYTEYLRYLGVRSSDARLQRPEYLGGGKQTISFSEVLQTAEGTDAVGTMRGHGISAMRSRRFLRFFEEHGVVMTLASVRPKTMYTDGLHRMWSRRTKEDFWQKELESIGQQEVLRGEVYANATDPNATFGYQDRYSEYRHQPSGISGDFRTTLNDWHLARIFGSEPTLNGAFVTCDPSKRIHAVQTDDVLWCLFNHSVQARRLVSKRAVNRVL